MDIRRWQGYSLILSAVLGVVTWLGPDNSLFGTLSVVSILLFIFGIPAVYTSQPIGTAGLIGIVLIILAAVIALGFRLLDIDLNPTLVDILFWTSVIGGSVGRVIVGWLTTRHKVFPAWAGWALIIEGITIFPVGSIESLANVTEIVVTLVGAVALLGYGYTLVRAPSKVATA